MHTKMVMALRLVYGQVAEAAEAKSTAAITSESLHNPCQEESMVSKGQLVNKCARCPLRDQCLTRAFGLPKLGDGVGRN